MLFVAEKEGVAPQGARKYYMWVEEGSMESWRILFGALKAIEKSYANENLALVVARQAVEKIPMTEEFHTFLTREGFSFVAATLPGLPNTVGVDMPISSIYSHLGVLLWRVENDWRVFEIEGGCLFLWVGGNAAPCPDFYNESMAKEMG